MAYRNVENNNLPANLNNSPRKRKSTTSKELVALLGSSSDDLPFSAPSRRGSALYSLDVNTLPSATAVTSPAGLANAWMTDCLSASPRHQQPMLSEAKSVSLSPPTPQNIVMTDAEPFGNLGLLSPFTLNATSFDEEAARAMAMPQYAQQTSKLVGLFASPTSSTASPPPMNSPVDVRLCHNGQTPPVAREQQQAQEQSPANTQESQPSSDTPCVPPPIHQPDTMPRFPTPAHLANQSSTNAAQSNLTSPEAAFRSPADACPPIPRPDTMPRFPTPETLNMPSKQRRDPVSPLSVEVLPYPRRSSATRHHNVESTLEPSQLASFPSPPLSPKSTYFDSASLHSDQLSVRATSLASPLQSPASPAFSQNLNSPLAQTGCLSPNKSPEPGEQDKSVRGRSLKSRKSFLGLSLRPRSKSRDRHQSQISGDLPPPVPTQTGLGFGEPAARPRRPSFSSKLSSFLRKKKADDAPPLPVSPIPLEDGNLPPLEPPRPILDAEISPRSPSPSLRKRASALFSRRLSRSASSPDLRLPDVKREGRFKVGETAPSLPSSTSFNEGLFKAYASSTRSDPISRQPPSDQQPLDSASLEGYAINTKAVLLPNAFQPIGTSTPMEERPSIDSSLATSQSMSSRCSSPAKSVTSIAMPSDYVQRPTNLTLEIGGRLDRPGSATSDSPSSSRAASIFDSSLGTSSSPVSMVPSPRFGYGPSWTNGDKEDDAEVLNGSEEGDTELADPWLNRRLSSSHSERSSSPVPSIGHDLVTFGDEARHPSAARSQTSSMSSKLSSAPQDGEQRTNAHSAYPSSNISPQANRTRSNNTVFQSKTNSQAQQNRNHKSHPSESDSDDGENRRQFGRHQNSSDSSESDSDESSSSTDSDDDVPLGQRHPEAVKPRPKRSSKITSPAKRRSKMMDATAEPPKRNPFAFQSIQMSKNPIKKSGKSVPVSSDATAVRPSKRNSSPPPLLAGHSLLPQTDESVRNRQKGSSKRAAELPPFVQNARLEISDDENPLAQLARAQTFAASKAPRRQPPARSMTTAGSSSRPAREAAPRRAAPVTKPVESRPIEPVGPTHNVAVYLDEQRPPLQLDYQSTSLVKELLPKALSKAQVAEARRGKAALWESWTALGLERPLRAEENLGVVMSCWPDSSRKAVALSLRPRGSSAMRQSNANGCFARLQLRSGKWEKRWITIEAGVVIHAKDEKMRDRTPLCPVASFDIFRVHDSTAQQMRCPKPFVLALKSLDQLEIFEDVRDAVHFLALKTKSDRDHCLAVFDEARLIAIQANLAAAASAAVEALQLKTARARSRSVTSPPPPSESSSRSPKLSSPPLPLFQADSLLAKAEARDPQWAGLDDGARKDVLQRAQTVARSEGRTLINLVGSVPMTQAQSAPIPSTRPRAKSFKR